MLSLSPYQFRGRWQQSILLHLSPSGERSRMSKLACASEGEWVRMQSEIFRVQRTAWAPTHPALSPEGEREPQWRGDAMLLRNMLVRHMRQHITCRRIMSPWHCTGSGRRIGDEVWQPVVDRAARAPAVVTCTLPDARRFWSCVTFRIASFFVGVHTLLTHAMLFVAPAEITIAASAVLATPIEASTHAAAKSPKLFARHSKIVDICRASLKSAGRVAHSNRRYCADGSSARD